jgi:hypothetical protein
MLQEVTQTQALSWVHGEFCLAHSHLAVKPEGCC